MEIEKGKGIVEKIRKFVEEECEKPSSKYGYNPFKFHFISVVKYARTLAEKLNADVEVVELAAWLHDIGSIIYGRENHHVSGAEIAEKKLRELNYSEEKIKMIKHCIVAHRGSQQIKRESVEAQIIADADGMSIFDNLAGVFMAAFVFENKNQEEAQSDIVSKLERTYAKLSDDAKKIVAEKYKAAGVLFK